LSANSPSIGLAAVRRRTTIDTFLGVRISTHFSVAEHASVAPVSDEELSWPRKTYRLSLRLLSLRLLSLRLLSLRLMLLRLLTPPCPLVRRRFLASAMPT
jgi:hypothetical protein